MLKYVKANIGYYLVCVVLVMFIAFYHYKANLYPNEVIAYLDSIERPNDDRVLIGYTARNMRVYDRPAVNYVVGKYVYEVDGITYSFTHKAVVADETLRLRYKDDPTVFTIDYTY